MQFCKFCKIVADLCSHGSMATFQQLHGCRVCEMSCWQLIALLGKLQKQEQAISIFISQRVHWFRALTPVKFASVPLSCLMRQLRLRALITQNLKPLCPDQFKRPKIIRILFSLISWLHPSKIFSFKATDGRSLKAAPCHTGLHHRARSHVRQLLSKTKSTGGLCPEPAEKWPAFSAKRDW